MKRYWTVAGLLSAHCLAVCLMAGTALAEEDIVPDITKIRGMELFKGPESATELLKRNGFVVVPRFYHRIFSPYVHSKLAPYVTADSLHRTFHVIFEEEIKKMEAANAPEVISIAAHLQTVLGVYPSDEHKPEMTKAITLAYHFLMVGNALQWDGSTLGEPPAEVAKELKLIRAAAGPAPSPLFGYDIDYSQFQPRGFYAETELLQRYFCAMTWFGTCVFRLEDDRETLAAVLIARAMLDAGRPLVRWKKIDRVYTALLGPCDDLTPEDYVRVVTSVKKGDLEHGKWVDVLGRFRKCGLRDPRINAMIQEPEAMRKWKQHAKGMCFFGRRYLPARYSWC